MINLKSLSSLHICIYIALAIHTTLILGVAFYQPPPPQASKSLEVTLAAFKSDQAPDEADFIAQANQLGSGTLNEADLPSTTETADFQSNKINTTQDTQKRASPTPVPTQKTLVSTTSPSQTKPTSTLEIPHTDNIAQTQNDWWSITEKSQEIASLEAQLRERRQEFAKRPRIRQVTAASTRQSDDALYLDAWRTKIEAVANKHYDQLGIRSLWGELRLMVAINKNGTIHSMQLLESSGHPALDAAALRIVRMAAPFDPFPPEIRKNTDILQIIRTWRNKEGQYVAQYE